MNSDLIYVAPRESMEYILSNGIFTPKKVNELIKNGQISREVLGVSWGPDKSNFSNYVSLLENSNIAKRVTQQICFSRTGSYSGDFMAICYSIKSELRDHPNFIPNKQVKQMNPNCYLFEVLYPGDIPKELINLYFAIRV